MPCVFAPYGAADIHQVYAQGYALQDAWQAPFLRSIRRWVEHHQPEPEDEAARQALIDVSERGF
jgi:hypothetical protein